MIYEDLYKGAIASYLDNTRKHYSTYIIKPTNGMSLEQLIVERDNLKAMVQTLTDDRPSKFDFDIASALQQHFAPMLAGYDNRIKSIHSDFENGIRMLQSERENRIAEAEETANLDILPLVKKHQELMSYKDKLNEVLIRYNITASDIKVSPDISREEFEAVLDTALQGCKDITHARSMTLVSKLKSLTNSPSSGSKLIYVIVLIGGSVILAPFILIWLFFYMYTNVGSIYKKLDKLRIAESMMYSVDFSKFLALEEVKAIGEIDTSELEEMREEALKEAEQHNPSSQYNQEQKALAAEITSLSETFRITTMKAEGIHSTLLKRVIESYESLCETVDDYISKNKQFGTYMNEKPVMSWDYTLGKLHNSIDVKYKLPLKNIVFIDQSRNQMIDFMKLMICNAILSVKEKHLYVTIYDPANLGAEFSEFFSATTQEYIDVKTKELEPIINDLKVYTQENIKILGKQTIDEYNEASDAVGKITRDYKLLVITSEAKKALEIAGFAKFMEYSAQYGVIIWMLSPTPIAGTALYQKPYQGVETPLQVTPELVSTCMETYTKAVLSSMADSIDYESVFASKYISPEKYWTYSTNKGISLNFGLESGDPTKGYELVLGDGNVHALMVGTTGAGKSAAINQMLATMLRKYSPKELELVMVDFKNVEFAMFTNKATSQSRIPHAKIIAGTKDGEYAISVFEYLCKEMDRRTALFSAVGVKNIATYNDKMTSNGTPEKRLPRILVLIDEFQVMFSEVDAKSVDKISSMIRSLSKLARFCGCHMWFTSQSMKDTMSPDIMDQFSLRVALRCSKDVSSAIIGSPVAGTIKTKFGYLYTNTSGGNDQSTTALWRIPYLSEEGVLRTLDIMDELCKKHNVPSSTALFYNEEKRHNQEELLSLYKANNGFPDNPRLMVLGERTGFSLNRAPINFNFTVDDGENMAALAFERADILNICMTVRDNVVSKDGARLIVHSADRDAHTLLDIEHMVPPELVESSLPSFEFEEWIEILEGMIASRQGRPKEELSPIFFLAIQWEKYRGLGREEKGALTDKFKRIVQTAPTVDIHFIFVSKSGKEFPSSLLQNCSHRLIAKCDEQEVFKYANSSRPTKLPEMLGFAMYSYGSSLQKFKLYQHTFSRQLEKREIVL